ncbi:MAG: SRPBCC family protein [Spirochaetales bacterium]|nr:SRPBCC family protein [Spirochaetales bacterium]
MAEMKMPVRRSADDLYVVIEEHINAPVEVVFSVVEDLQLFVELEENVKKVTITSEIEKGLGLKTSWELYHPDSGASWFVDEEIVYYDSPRRYAYEGYSPDGKNYAGLHNLSPTDDGGTNLRFEEYFYFSTDEHAMTEIVRGMVNNVKKAAELKASKAES